jgi:hypothetical protein
VLQELADLAPSTEPRGTALAVPTDWFRWLSLSAPRIFRPHGEFDDDGAVCRILDEVSSIDQPLAAPVGADDRGR